MSASTSSALRQTMMPRSTAIARVHAASSMSVSTCGSLVRVPLPLLGVICGWLRCVDLLTLFRVNRTLVALHHCLPAGPSFFSSLPSATLTGSSHRSDWVAAAWSSARLTVTATHKTMFVEQAKQPRLCDASVGPRQTYLFPNLDRHQQPARLCRLVLAASPHLRHLRVHLDTYAFGYMADMADTLDMTPSLHTLTLSAEATDCTGQHQLYIPLTQVLAHHPRLHELHCNGFVVLSVQDVLAIGSHPALTHITVLGDLIWGDGEEEFELEFNPCQLHGEALWSERCIVVCDGCTSSSVAVRLALLRHVLERCIEEDHSGEFEQSDGGVQIRKLIGQLELEKSERARSWIDETCNEQHATGT